MCVYKYILVHTYIYVCTYTYTDIRIYTYSSLTAHAWMRRDMPHSCVCCKKWSLRAILSLIGICHCANAVFLQVLTQYAFLDLGVLYIWILGKYCRFVRQIKLLAYGVAVSQPCSSAGHRFAASGSCLDYYRPILQIVSIKKNSTKCLVNWIPLRIRVRSRNTHPYHNDIFEFECCQNQEVYKSYL